MLKKCLFCLLSCFVSVCGAQETVTLLFAGDAMAHTVQHAWALQATGTYNYDACYASVARFVQRADVACVNLETTLAGAPYTGYPAFSAPDTFLDALQKAGFDVYFLANNHMADKGLRGIDETVRKLADRNLAFAGAYATPFQRAARYPLLVERKGLRIAFFCCTYGTNGNAVRSPNVVNLLDTAQISADLQQLQDLDVDLKIMMVHWGTEYELQANARQREMARWLVSRGFDLIVGSHPHVVQNVEFLTAADGREVPVFYSLGNFISNQRWRNSNGGIMAAVRVNVATKRIAQVCYLPVYVHKGVLDGVVQYHLLPTPYMGNRWLARGLSVADSVAMAQFDSDVRTRLPNVLQMPYNEPEMPRVEWNLLKKISLPTKEIVVSDEPIWRLSALQTSGKKPSRGGVGDD